MADNTAIIQEIKLILNSDLSSLGKMENALKALQSLTKEINVKDIASKKELEAALAVINKLILQESEGYKIAANSAKELLAINQKETTELSKQDAIKEEQRQKNIAAINLAHQQANVINQQIDRQNILNARAERHALIRKTLSNTLHQNANTLERMQHNQSVLNARLNTTVIGSEKYKNIQAQIATLQEKISAATAKTQIGLAGAFREATGLQKAFNRMAFVFTAMISYMVLDLGKKMIAGPVKATIAWEEELSKVYTLLDATEQRFRGALEGTVKSLVSDYGQSLEDAARAVYDILSARFDPQDVEIISRESALLAIGEFTDIKLAVSAVTTVLNSFSLSANKAGEAASFLAQMVTDGKTTLAELEPNLGKITSVAGTLGYDMKQLGAAFSTITLQGYKSNVAITSLSTLMLRLLSPTDKAKEVINKYGLELDIASIKAGGFNKVMQEMIGLTEEEMLAFATNRRGAKALFALMNSGAKFQESYNNQLVLSNVHLAKYEDRMNNLSLLTKQVAGETEILAKSVGDTWNPTLKILLGTIKFVLEFLNKLPGQILAIIPAIAILSIKLKAFFTSTEIGVKKLGLTIKAQFATVTLGATALGEVIIGVFSLITKSMARASESFLQASARLLEISDKIAALNAQINALDFQNALSEYNKTFGTTITNEKELNEELAKQLILERDASIAVVEYRNEHGLILQDINERSAAGKKLNAVEKTFLLEYNSLLTDRNDKSQQINTIQNLLNKSKTEEVSRQKELVRQYDEEIEKQNNLFNLSKKTVNDLQNQLTAQETKLNGINNIIAGEKQLAKTKEDAEKIDQRWAVTIQDTNEKIFELKGKISEANKQLAKDELALNEARYKASEVGIGKVSFGELINAHYKYLASLTDEIDILNERLAIEKLIADQTKKDFNEKYKLRELITRTTEDNIDDIELRRDKELALTDDIVERQQIILYYNRLIAEEEQKIADDKKRAIEKEVNSILKAGKIKYYQLELLKEQYKDNADMLAYIIELEKKWSQTRDDRFNVKTILGIPDFEDAAAAKVYVEDQMADAIMGIQEAVLQHQLDMIERGKEAKLEALTVEYDAYRDQAAGTVLTDAHRARVLASIAKKEAEEKKKIEEDAQKAMAKQKKNNAIAEVGISFAQGLVGIASSTLGMGPLGIPWWVLLTGILTATHAAQLAIIEGTKFAVGGIADGPSHAQGGIQMFHKSGAHIGEMEGHEMIHSKKATTGNETQLIAQNEALSRGISFDDFARNYLLGRLNSYIPSSSPVISYQRSYATGGISQAGSGVVIDFTTIQNDMREQLAEQREIASSLKDISESNRENTEMLNRIRKKGVGV